MSHYITLTLQYTVLLMLLY